MIMVSIIFIYSVTPWFWLCTYFLFCQCALILISVYISTTIVSILKLHPLLAPQVPLQSLLSTLFLALLLLGIHTSACFCYLVSLFLVLLLHYISMALICSGRCYHLWNIAPHIGPSDTLMKTFAFDEDDDDDDDYNYNVDQKREHISVHRNIYF